MRERILVVDDHESWSRLISAALQKDSRWSVVETASDGLEAIHKTDALLPTLVLMDVELPELDGVEAARRILAKHPETLILFVSAHRSGDIVEAAMGTGARGYVVKAESGRDLPLAIERAMQGSRYLSPVLYGRSTEPRGNRRPTRHEVGFYERNAALVDAYAEFAGRALLAGDSVSLFATSAHLAGVRDRLLKQGVDVDLAERQLRYRPADAEEVTDSFMVNGSIDEILFWKTATAFVVRAAAEAPDRPVHIVACGECAGVLIEQGHLEAAIRLEQLCTQMAAAFDVEVLCGYCTAASHTSDPALLHRIELEHNAVCSR